MKIERKRIAELRPSPYNPRKDIQVGDAEYEKLRRSLQEFGYVEPIIWNERTGNVVGGHQRLKVLRQLGETELDCVIVDLPEEQEKALNIALNKIRNEWDPEKLEELLFELQSGEIDVKLTGFDSEELDEVFKSAVEDIEEVNEADEADDYESLKRENREQGYSNVEVDRTYNLYRLYEYAPARTAGYYQFPTVKACHYVPEKLIGFDELPLRNGIPEKTGVHFFIHDYQFNRMWTRPYENIERLRGFDCVQMPDFSTYWDMPMAMKIWNVYRMRLISQVMQDECLEVIPIIRGIGDETLSWCFDGIEVGGVYAYSTIGLLNNNATFRDICRRELAAAIEQLKPECLILYGKDVGFDFGGVPVKRIGVREVRM